MVVEEEEEGGGGGATLLASLLPISRKTLSGYLSFAASNTFTSLHNTARMHQLPQRAPRARARAPAAVAPLVAHVAPKHKGAAVSQPQYALAAFLPLAQA